MINIDEYKILFDKYYKNFFIEILNNNIFEDELKQKFNNDILINNINKEEYIKLIENIINNIFKKL